MHIKIITYIINDLINAEFAQKIRHRLLRQAPLLFISYGERECGWALAAAEKLKKESKVPLENHIFIREMAIIGLTHFIEGI